MKYDDLPIDRDKLYGSYLEIKVIQLKRKAAHLGRIHSQLLNPDNANYDEQKENQRIFKNESIRLADSQNTSELSKLVLAIELAIKEMTND